MKYLVTIQTGAEIHFDDPDEPMIRYPITHDGKALEEILVFRGGGAEEYIIAFNPIPPIQELGHAAEAVCNGHLCGDADELVAYIETLPGLRLEMGRLMLEKEGVRFADIKAAMIRSLGS